MEKRYILNPFFTGARVIEKAPPTSANLHLWRKAIFAVVACYRMRLDLERKRALDLHIANQDWPFKHSLDETNSATGVVSNLDHTAHSRIINRSSPNTILSVRGSETWSLLSHLEINQHFQASISETSSVNNAHHRIQAQDWPFKYLLDEISSGAVSKSDEGFNFALDDNLGLVATNSATGVVSNMDHTAHSRLKTLFRSWETVSSVNNAHHRIQAQVHQESAPANAKRFNLEHNLTCQVLSPCHSGSRLLDDSPNALWRPCSDYSGDTVGHAHQYDNEATTSALALLPLLDNVKGSLCEKGLPVKGTRKWKKRKLMPKVIVKQPAIGTDSECDGPLDDGHTWQKYGSKPGSKNPRNYYKCKHPGCPVRKSVQRCHDDPSTFDVTYQGDHIHSSSVKLEVQQHNFSAKAADSNPSEQAASDLSGLTQVSRDILFGPKGNLCSNQFVEPEYSNPSEQAASDLSGLTQASRDGLFAGKFYDILLARSRPESTSHNSHMTSARSPLHSPQHTTCVRAPAKCLSAFRPWIIQQNPTSTVLSPCNTAHVVSKMSDDSPNPLSPPVHLNSDGDALAAALAATVVAATSPRAEIVKQWSFFMNRCRPKMEWGYPTTKPVHRGDDDSSTFDVTDRGNQTCQSIDQLQREVEDRREDGYFLSSEWLLGLEQNQRESLMSILSKSGYSETSHTGMTILFERNQFDSHNGIDVNNPSSFVTKCNICNEDLEQAEGPKKGDVLEGSNNDYMPDIATSHNLEVLPEASGNTLIESTQTPPAVNIGGSAPEQGSLAGVMEQSGLYPFNQTDQNGHGLPGQTSMGGGANAMGSSVTGPMIPTPWIPESPAQVQSYVGVSNTGVPGHLPTASTGGIPPQPVPGTLQKYTRLWEGVLALQSNDGLSPLPICKLEDLVQFTPEVPSQQQAASGAVAQAAVTNDFSQNQLQGQPQNQLPNNQLPNQLPNQQPRSQMLQPGLQSGPSSLHGLFSTGGDVPMAGTTRTVEDFSHVTNPTAASPMVEDQLMNVPLEGKASPERCITNSTRGLLLEQQPPTFNSFLSALKSSLQQSYAVNTDWLSSLKDQEKTELETITWEAGYTKMHQDSDTIFFERIRDIVKLPLTNLCNNPRGTSDKTGVGISDTGQEASGTDGLPRNDKLKRKLDDADSKTEPVGFANTVEKSRMAGEDSPCHPQILKVTCSSLSQMSTMPSTSSSHCSLRHSRRQQFGDSIVTMPRKGESRTISTTMEKPLSMTTVDFSGGKNACSEVCVTLKAIATTTIGCCIRLDQNPRKIRVKFGKIRGEVKRDGFKEQRCNALVLSSLRTNVYACINNEESEGESEEIILKLEDEYFVPPRRRVIGDHVWLKNSEISPDNCESGSITLELQGDVRKRCKADLAAQVQRAHVLHFQEPRPVVLEGELPVALDPNLFLELNVRCQLEVSYIKPCTPIPREAKFVAGRRISEVIDFDCTLDFMTKKFSFD